MLQLELELPPAFAAGLTRIPALRPLFAGGRRARTALSIVWHDSEAGDLAAAGETLAERRQGRSHGFRLERIRPAENACSPGGTPEAVLGTALTADAFGARVPERVSAVVGFEGTLRNLGVADPGIEAQVMDGVLRAANFSRPTSRLLLSGPAAPVTALAQRWRPRCRWRSRPGRSPPRPMRWRGRTMRPARCRGGWVRRNFRPACPSVAPASSSARIWPT